MSPCSCPDTSWNELSAHNVLNQAALTNRLVPNNYNSWTVQTVPNIFGQSISQLSKLAYQPCSLIHGFVDTYESRLMIANNAPGLYSALQDVRRFFSEQPVSVFPDLQNTIRFVCEKTLSCIHAFYKYLLSLQLHTPRDRKNTKKKLL